MKPSSRAFVLLTCALAVLPAGGCYQGFNGTVNSQQPSGNGTYLSQGGISVQNAVLVSGTAESGTSALSFTMVNVSETADALESVTVPAPATAGLAGPIELPARNVIAVGGPNEHQIDLTKFQTPAGSYADVVFKFREAGELAGQVLVVPPTGAYAAYAPSAKPTKASADKETANSDAKAK